MRPPWMLFLLWRVWRYYPHHGWSWPPLCQILPHSLSFFGRGGLASLVLLPCSSWASWPGSSPPCVVPVGGLVPPVAPFSSATTSDHRSFMDVRRSFSCIASILSGSFIVLVVWSKNSHSQRKAGQMEPCDIYILTIEDDVIWYFGSHEL